MIRQIEVGNVIIVRKYEPGLRITGIVTEVNDDSVGAIVVRTNKEHKFLAVHAFEEFDKKDVDVLTLPSEVFA